MEMRSSFSVQACFGLAVVSLAFGGATCEKVHRFALDEFILPWGEPETIPAGRGIQSGGASNVVTALTEGAHMDMWPFKGLKMLGIECTPELILAGAVGVGCVGTLGIGVVLNFIGDLLGMTPKHRKKKLMADLSRLQSRLDNFALER